MRASLFSALALVIYLISPAFAASGYTAYLIEAPEDTLLASDLYGYQMWEVDPLPAFIEIAPPSGPGTAVTFSSRDDGISSQLLIGFDFNFYEGTYSSIYLDTNGVAYFDNQSTSHANNNPLPQPTEPNNILALCGAISAWTRTTLKVILPDMYIIISMISPV